MIGAFFAPTARTGKGFRSEIVFSRQGYSFDDGGTDTDLLNNYLYLPQMVTFNIGRFFQLQAGAQVGVLLNSKMSGSKDSTIIGLMNRVDYGFAAGIELNPVNGVLIGGRYNLGLGKLYKQYETNATDPYPFPLPFNPETTNLKNGVVQFFYWLPFLSKAAAKSLFGRFLKKEMIIRQKQSTGQPVNQSTVHYPRGMIV